jgi:hypothetical protein
MLENQGETDIPCMSTINAILKRNNLITPEASAKATPYKRFEMAAPNDMWQCDFKGHYELQSGVRCHPLSVIDPKHPQSQGKVEKFNGSFKRERLKFYTPADMDDAQAQRLEYRDFYNNTRPHHAMKLDTPSMHYEPSSRNYSCEVRDWEYENGCEVRKIKDTGYFNYKGQGYYLSEGFRGKTIAIKPSETNENAVNICFREFQIGVIDLAERAIISRKARLLKSDKPSDTAA